MTTVRFIVYLFLVGSSSIMAWGKGDSTRNQFYWLNTDLNYIQFYDRSVFQPFYDKWMKGEPITIVHFGDSHVQPDIYTGELRKILQAERGMGGRGMIFPYSIAQTYATLDYASYHTGSWRSSKSIEYIPKLPLGISGVTAKTSDGSASFTIRFHNPMPAHYRKLKLFVKQHRASYDVVVSSGGESIAVEIDEPVNPDQSYIEIVLPVIGSTLKVQVVKKNDFENDFEFHGMSLESVTTEGLILHCLGIGGSQFRSLLAEKLFDVQVASVKPDLAILDFGTNDHIYNNMLPPDMESVIVKSIARVRAAAPNCTVLLTTTQDMNRKGQNITSGRDYSALIRKVAKDQNCIFYDWYWVSGGPKRMTLWENYGLAQADNIHLTIKGYGLKGELLGDAFKNTISKMHIETPSLAFNPDTLSYDAMIARQDSMMRKNANTPIVAQLEPKPVNVIYHKIQTGETLGGIAEKYHVSVSSIKMVNGIRGSKIIAGKTLRIEQPKAYIATASNKEPVKVKQATEDKKINDVFTQIANTKLVQHKIASGETLGAIAEKYNVTVKDLKRVNGLKSSRIIAGKTLMIEVPREEKKNKT